jgi:ornithine cyclodeaminase/alanine dehydrogenase-like protein (mu-crystallin family)
MTEALGKPVVCVDTEQAAVEGADIVVDATRLDAEQTLVRTESIGPGALVMPCAVSDIAIGALALARARERGVGTTLTYARDVRER